MGRSAAFREHLDVRGVWFPAGDGDALRDAASGWFQTAEFLDDIAAVLVAAATNITDNYRGEAAERFVELWARWCGDDGYLAATVRACRQLAATLEDFGGDVDRADATLLGLVEEALDLRLQAAEQPAVDLHAADRAIDEWLRDAAGQVAAGLDRQVANRVTALGDVAKLPDELAPIDPSRVDWVTPGDVTDLTHLATATVDFGAGPGSHRGAPIDTVFPDELADAAALADRGPQEGGAPLELPDDWAGAGGGDWAGAGGGGGYGAGSGFDMPEFDLPAHEQPDLPAFEAPDVDPSAFDADPTIVGGAAIGAGATAAAAAATKAGRSAPMMPFMPMGAGGIGGDDGKEPTRRRRRVVVVPPVA